MRFEILAILASLGLAAFAAPALGHFDPDADDCDAVGWPGNHASEAIHIAAYHIKAQHPTSDWDSDGIQNDEDNCPCTANNGQENTDAHTDRLGDACDADFLSVRDDCETGQSDNCLPVGADDYAAFGRSLYQPVVDHSCILGSCTGDEDTWTNLRCYDAVIGNLALGDDDSRNDSPGDECEEFAPTVSTECASLHPSYEDPVCIRHPLDVDGSEADIDGNGSVGASDFGVFKTLLYTHGVGCVDGDCDPTNEPLGY